MSFRFRKKMILAKTEVTYGTDPTPVEGDDAILTSNLSITPYGGNTVQRNLDNANLGNDESYNVGAMVQVEFDIEISGSSAIGVAPNYDALLQACGLADTVVALTSTQYDPVSESFDSATIYFNIDGQEQRIKGARGTCSIKLTRGQLPYLHFVMTGLYTRPTAVSMYAPDFSGFKKPVPVNNTNTGTVLIHGFAATLEDFSFDLNAEIVHRNLPGNDSVEYIDRAPSGTLVIESPAIATKDYFTAMESHAGVTLGVIDIIHGPAANRFKFYSALTQLSNLKMGESDGLMTYTFDVSFLPSDAGDDDFFFFYD